jgi:hypothetical protein
MREIDQNTQLKKPEDPYLQRYLQSIEDLLRKGGCDLSIKSQLVVESLSTMN